jgi:hypothetical protein
MDRRSRVFVLVTLTAAFMFTALPAADAYVDPGSGSFIFQAIVGGALAAGLAIKMFWRRIVSFVTRRDRPADES